MKTQFLLFVVFLLFSCNNPNKRTTSTNSTASTEIEISREDYANKLYGFWLAACRT